MAEPPAGSLQRHSEETASLASLDAVPQEISADLLPRLEMEDYVPSVRPWLRLSAAAVLVSVGLGGLFIAICPYVVVVRGQGTMRPAGDQVVVNAPFAGRVVGIAVRSNQKVEAGQPIMTLDPSELQGAAVQLGKSSTALVEQQQALRSQEVSDEARARLEVEKSQAALDFARSEYERYEGLVKQGAATQSDFEAKLASYNQSRALLAQAREGLAAVRSQARQRQAELRKEKAGVEQSSQDTRRNLRNSIVRSPVRGVVFQMLVRSLQQTVGMGEQLAIITPSTAELQAKVQVSSEEVETVRPGQKADLRVVGCPYPDFGTLPAEVVAVSPDALEESNRYEVTLRPQRRFLTSRIRRCEVKIGMPVQADIRTREETILLFLLRKTRMVVGA